MSRNRAATRQRHCCSSLPLASGTQSSPLRSSVSSAIGKTDEVLVGSKDQTNLKRKETLAKPSHQQAQFQSEMFNTKDDSKASRL